MARKRRAPNYTGALAQPITGPLGQPNRKLDKDAIKKRAEEKVRLLFEHYKIDPSNEQRWQKLALRLALAHVRGLQFADRPKRGRKSTWKTTGLGDELVRAVEDVKSRTGKRTKEAIAELQKEPKWKTYPSGEPIPAPSLGARYREARARQKALASWEKDLAALFATAAPLGRPHEVTGRRTKSGARTKKKPRRK